MKYGLLLLRKICVCTSTINCFLGLFSVLGSSISDGRPSDTEDLVKDDLSSYNNEAHVNPGLASSSSSENSSHDNHPIFENHEVKFEASQLLL